MSELYQIEGDTYTLAQIEKIAIKAIKEMNEIKVAMRDLEDEYADGLISEHAYTVRKAELQKIGEGK
jgi:hypothetical protein